MITRRIRVLNSLLFIKDAATDKFPEIDGLAAVWATADCCAISCLPDSDGETEIKIGRGGEVPEGRHQLFSGMLRTPSRLVTVEGVAGPTGIEFPVASTETKLIIWTDGYRDTETVNIQLEP